MLHMAEMDLINRIASQYSHFTKSEKKVADFVLAYPNEAINLTIVDLAERCGVGDTTVFRFCRSLKLNGYQDFKLSLAISINSKTMLDSGKNISVIDSKDIKELSQKVLSVYTDSLNDTFNILNYRSISKAVDLLINARIIYLFGFGGSAITALEMQNKFIKIMPNISFSMDAHTQLTIAALLKPDDVAFIFSNSGITKDCIEIARLSKAAGAKTVFVTRFMKTPAAQYTDVLLPCGATEGPLEGGSISATSSQMFMVDILYAECFRRMGEKATDNKEKTARVITEKML